MTDLSKFCAKPSDCWPHLEKPFSHGAWTYATNGRLMVRVSRRDNVPENEKAPNEKVEGVFEERPIDGAVPIAKIEIKADELDECDECEGRGVEHPCPDCTCTCAECQGTGRPDLGAGLRFSFGPAMFNGRHIGLIKDLPDLQFGPPDAEKALRFKFEGGEGVLMPMRGDRSECIEIETSPLSRTEP